MTACICDEFICLDRRFLKIAAADECVHCAQLAADEPCPAHLAAEEPTP